MLVKVVADYLSPTRPLPSYYRTISLPDTVGKLFEKILLARVLREENERGLLRDTSGSNPYIERRCSWAAL
jgi:hypothetical protein